jgi:hypothetical protein
MNVTITTDRAPGVTISCANPEIINVIAPKAISVRVEMFRDGKDGADGIKGDKGDQGDQGVSGMDAINYIRKHNFVSGTSYNGKAPIGSLETDHLWNITKIIVSPNGTTTTTIANNVSWTNRLTNSYT